MNDNKNDRTDLSQLRIDRESDREPVPVGKYIRLALWVIMPLLGFLLLWLLLRGITPSADVRTAMAAPLSQNEAQSVLSATGYVVAQRQAAVASKGTGRLEFIGVEEGDKVLFGQVIGRLENADMIAALELAQANLAQARAESTEAALNFNRQKQLFSSGSITRADYEVSEARYLSASAFVKSSEAAAKSAEVALENTIIRAPFDGTVLNKYADVGEIVAPFASSASSRGAVVVLADMSSLEVEADVSESNIQRVKPGQPCEIILDAYPDFRYKGHVKKIVPTADRSRATVMTKVTFEAIDERVLPEMSARVNFFETDSTKQTLEIISVSIPNSALMMKNNSQVVFIIEEKRARQVEVAIGKKLGTQTEIVRGLRAGQIVVISPPSDLKDGMKVKIIQ